MDTELALELLDAFNACESVRVDVYETSPWLHRVAVALTFEDVLMFFWNFGMGTDLSRGYILMPH